MQNRKSIRLITAVFVLVLGVAADNAWARNSTPSTKSLSPQGTAYLDAWLRISAFTDVPLAGADVAVYDTAGQLLFEQHKATNNQGIFPARVQTLPQDFRVTVTWAGSWGDLQRGLLDGFQLSADVQNFNPVHDIVYVNPITTLVSRVMDKSSGRLTLQQTQALVRNFLGLPANASLGAALRQGKYFQSQYFSQSAFLAEAAKYGGVKPLLEALLSEILTQPEQPHPFAPAPGSSVGSVLSFVAENLAKGALSWAAGQGCGWAAQSAGLTTPGATAEDIANLQAGLADLQSSVDDLSKRLDTLTQQVLAQLTQTQYNTIAVPALALAAQVNGVESDLTFFAQGCPAIPETGTLSADAVSSDFCTSQKATIVAELNDVTINHSYETLAAYLLDNQTVGFKGMIHLMSQAQGQTVRFFRRADSTKLDQMFQYWDAVESQAANLKIELLHLNDAQDNPGGIAQLTAFLGDATANPPTQGTFQNTHLAELFTTPPEVPSGAVVNTKDRTMWMIDYPATTGATCFSPPTPGGSGPPPYGGAWTSPETSSLYAYNLLGWTSPTVNQVQALIDGWTGVNPNQWLIDNSKAVAPDSPVEPGFVNIATHYYPCTQSPTIWTRDLTGKGINSGGQYYYIWYVVNLADGTVSSADDKQGAEVISVNWIFLVRTLTPGNPGEFYYYYP